MWIYHAKISLSEKFFLFFCPGGRRSPQMERYGPKRCKITMVYLGKYDCYIDKVETKYLYTQTFSALFVKLRSTYYVMVAWVVK